MQPIFPRINLAIHWTLEYYETGRIVDHLRKLAGELNLNYLDSHVKMVFDSHRDMDDEISQTIHTTNATTQIQLLERLKEWINDYRIREIDESYFVARVDEYNERVNQKFAEMIEEKVKSYREGPYFHLPHLEEYEEETTSIYYIQEVYRPFPHKTKKINYKYYCIEEKPGFVDTYFLEPYLELVYRIVASFRKVIVRYVRLYEQGKLPQSSAILVEQAKLPSADLKALPEPERPKLKTNLSVPQLAFLFKLLFEAKADLFDVKSKQDLFRFISANFSTKGKADEPISIDSLKNHFNNSDKATANFWVDYLKKMLEQSRKV